MVEYKGRKIWGAATTVMVVAGMVSLPGVAYAADEGDIEEIVVTGIKSSIEEALEIKRQNVNFVDAVTAEDVGKLPDRNVAEALQRVPGVTIQRERGEGDFVSIRGLGPEFVRGTVNGRTIVSGTESFNSVRNGAEANTTGRETNFDLLPSEIIDTLEVYKTTSAEHAEGGIGGVVNIKTARPMDLGHLVVGVVRGQRSDFREETDPSLSGLFSWTDDDTFGILGSISYSERSIREDIANAFGYYNFGPYTKKEVDGVEIDLDAIPPVTEAEAPTAPEGVMVGDPKGYDIDGDGFIDDHANPYAPWGSNPEIFLEERERITLNTTLQWHLGEATEIVFDAQWSEREVTSEQYGSNLFGLAAGFDSKCNVINDDGSHQCPDAVVQSNTIVRLPVNAPLTLFTDARSGEDTLFNFGLNVSHDIGAWQLTGDVSWADAEGDLEYNRVVAPLAGPDGGIPAVPIVVSTSGDAPSIVPDVMSDDFHNPDDYNIRQTARRIRENNDEELALRFDAEYIVEDSAISSIKLGVRYRTREKSFATRRGNNGGAGNIVSATTIPNSLIRSPGNFLDGGFSGLNPTNFLFPDVDAIAPFRDEPELNEDILAGFNTEEDTLAAYIQINLDTEIGDFPLSGNAGVRIVSTESEVAGENQGFEVVPQAEGSPINEVVLFGPVGKLSFNEDYTSFLPSLNLRLSITDELQARFAYGRTLTRPEFEQLAPAFNITNATNFIGSAGNPALRPYLSDNVDLGLEWYFSDASALTATVFYKQIDDYIVGFTNLDVELQGIVFASVTQPDNQGQADISGLELGYTQVLHFLPAPFDGLGIIFNYNSVNSNLELNNGDKLLFPGVSDASYNTALFYDKGPIQARLAYTWRDEFLFDPSAIWGNQAYVDEYEQFDFSASYRVTENVTTSFEVINLTDEEDQWFVDRVDVPANGTRPLSIGHVGRRISLGVSAKF